MIHSVVTMDAPLQKKTHYKQRYKGEWEKDVKFKGWLKPVAGDPSRAFCTYCNKDYSAKLSDVQRHGNSWQHLKKSKPIISKNQTTINIPVSSSRDTPTQQAEASLAMYVAEHTAILAVDHLAELCKNRFPDSRSTENLQLHRTKCTAIIREVLAPHFIHELRADINSAYSLLLDESTDIAVKKMLGVVVKYFSVKSSKIISSFLGLVELESSNAEGIVTALLGLLKNVKLDLKNLIGIGTDNAAVMVGANSGVHAILKETHSLPNLILVRCVCHSIQLAVSNASIETLPRTIEFLLRETYNWFKISPKRLSEYALLYQTINCGEDPLKILKTCETRWLSIEPAVTRILSQWDELKLHFELARSKENCYKAQLLHAMFVDRQNKIYITFLRGILDHVQKTIKIFENKASDPCLLYNTLIDLIQSLCLRIIIARPGMQFETVNVREHLSMSPYLGYLFEKELTEANLHAEEKGLIKQRCTEFIIKLINQLQERLPENIIVLQNSMCISVSEILKDNRLLERLLNLLKGLGIKEEKVDTIVREWHTIKLQEWTNKTDTEAFWAEVSKAKDATGINCPYQNLLEVAMKVMSLPHSNADIERVFSTMNIVKNKLRNALNVETINAILHIRMGLATKNTSCSSYILPDKVLAEIKSNKKYTWKLQTRSEPEPGPSGLSREPEPGPSGLSRATATVSVTENLVSDDEDD